MTGRLAKCGLVGFHPATIAGTEQGRGDEPRPFAPDRQRRRELLRHDRVSASNGGNGQVTMRARLRRSIPILCILFVFKTGACFGSTAARELYVDGTKGNDRAAGTSAAPLRTIDAALARLPGRIDDDVLVHLSGDIRSPHGNESATLDFDRPMRPGRAVRFVGAKSDTILNWTAPDGAPLIDVTQGRWSFEDVQLGSRAKDQRAGVRVTGPAVLELHSVRIRTASVNSPGIHSTRGGLVELYGEIILNDDLHDALGNAGKDSFCGIVADYSGVVRFREREHALLSVGNGSLSASYYGVIELGCATAQLTSWHEQANVIAVNNSGRVDLHSTKTVLAARNPRNTPIGLEDDGHVLAEGAPITIRGFDNSNAIVLQKASSFFCNDVTFDGPFHTALLASSGSTLLIGVIGDLPGGDATTGARIILEKCTGKQTRPVNGGNGGVVITPK